MKTKNKGISSGGKGGQMKINGLPVIDAKKPLDLHITIEDIRKSNAKNPKGCAAAVALMRQQQVTEARVHLTKVYVLDKPAKRYIRYDAPRSMKTEVVAFDRGGSFEPGDFTLKVPLKKRRTYTLNPPAIPLKGKTNRDKYGDYEPTGKRAQRHLTTNVRPMPERH